jgi:2-polyprenyl-6-methoxyphenol hydroxylase-like FAD-dependent oxidoreductase
MSESDYDTDILEWSEHQGALLRRLANGELVNSAELDWPNIAEEIESVGSEQLHAVESLLVQALIHMLKAEAWPLSRDVPHWRAEAIRFRGDAARRFVPSMRQRINLAALCRSALRAIPETIDDQPPLPVPELCPVTLDELLAE